MSVKKICWIDGCIQEFKPTSKAGSLVRLHFKLFCNEYDIGDSVILKSNIVMNTYRESPR
jgi:hypothetical protein